MAKKSHAANSAIVVHWNENRVSCEQSLSINYDASLNAKERKCGKVKNEKDKISFVLKRPFHWCG